MKQILQSCLFSTLAAAIGLAVVLVVGRIYWPLGSGLSGIAIGLFTAGYIALLMRFHFHTVTSVLAASLAGAMASFIAIANAEMLPPGSFEWMLKGGLYGACLGLPLAFLLGPIGMLENFLVPISSHHAKLEPKP